MSQPAILPLHAYGWRRPAAGKSEQWMETSADLGGDDFEDVSVLVAVDSFDDSIEIRDVRDLKGNDRIDDLTANARDALEIEAVEYVRDCRAAAKEAYDESRAEDRAQERSL